MTLSMTLSSVSENLEIVALLPTASFTRRNLPSGEKTERLLAELATMEVAEAERSGEMAVAAGMVRRDVLVLDRRRRP